MKNLTKNKNWQLLLVLAFSWTSIAFLSFRFNIQTIKSFEVIDKILLIHLFLWLVGILFSFPIVFKLFSQSTKVEKMISNEGNIFTLFNFINSPAFLYDKFKNEFINVNNVGITQFNIDIENQNCFDISELNCLKEYFYQFRNSTIKNVQIKETCIDSEGNEIILDITMHDIFINGVPITIIILNDNFENKKDIQEMHDYIEDLRANESIIEDNAFEMIQLNIKLEESEKNLKEVNANKDKFFSIVAHDLKSPFVGLLGITEMLDNDYDDFEEKERREFIHNLYESSKNTFELLEGLLDWARVKQGRMIFNPIDFNLFHLVDSLVNLLKANAFKKEITLKNSVDINSRVFADRDMISTVLRNLLANAIKFTNKNGTVLVTSEIENNLMKISIVDSGIGMSEKDQEKLFRIDVTHNTLGTNDEKGTGLGLILCKELIETHGTNIWVESNFGEGSKFIFTIPLLDNRT
ncbi:MAG: HAMP domain-containing histidine kinase [Bacteroidetes bacterium]|nr:HAMP domain-containing histidine kinase [Bacteroidota bacterium]MBU1116776.1 HAMP domain-containing histidine kinase [Bacteroidota bacterium]MBU1798835.1 HAMP domain-containing histidine kinase [Bacteroidota bacterium]